MGLTGPGAIGGRRKTAGGGAEPSNPAGVNPWRSLLESADDGSVSNFRNRYRDALETSHREPQGSAHVRRRLARRDERQAGLAEWGKGKVEEAGEREGVSLRWVWEVRASDSISFCVREHTCLSSIIIVNNYGKIEVRHTSGATCRMR